MQQKVRVERRISTVKIPKHQLVELGRGVKEMTLFSLAAIMRGTRFHEAGHAVAK